MEEDKEKNTNEEVIKEIQGEGNKNMFARYLIIIVVIMIAAPLMHLFTTKMLNNLIKDTPVVQLPNNGGDM